MILTNCAACAAPLAHNAPRCVRCKVRYCNSTCQHGERVKCWRGEWVPGRVVRLLYDEPGFEKPAAYQVKLDDGTLIYAPEDTDSYIREFNFNPYSRHRDWNRNVSSK